ncbi:hypothetical protein J3A83DRAFT_4188607 [Scleroderma citrinum]
MHMIAVDEYEEVEVNLKNADCQIGEVQHVLSSNGTALLEGKTKLLPVDGISDDEREVSLLDFAPKSSFILPRTAVDSFQILEVKHVEKGHHSSVPQIQHGLKADLTVILQFIFNAMRMAIDLF